MENGSKDRYFQSDAKKLVPEGVEGRVAYKGYVEDTVFQMLGGLRAGMGYCGAHNIKELQENSQFVKISAAALREDVYKRQPLQTGAMRMNGSGIPATRWQNGWICRRRGKIQPAPAADAGMRRLSLIHI